MSEQSGGAVTQETSASATVNSQLTDDGFDDDDDDDSHSTSHATHGSSGLCVIQSPSNITVNEGESAQISCCWSTSTYSVKVVWYINETKLSDPKQKLQERQNLNCSILNLTNILNNAAGHYVCEVTQDIPVLEKKNGTGTNVSISISELETTTNDNIHEVSKTPIVRGNSSLGSVVMIYIFRSLPFICLLSAFFYLNKTCKQVAQSKPDEDAVKSGEGQNEDLEVGETQMRESEEVKQGDKVSVQDEESQNTEKAEATAVIEDDKQENHEVKETSVDAEQVPVNEL